MKDGLTCPLHDQLQKRLDAVETNQKGRNCGANETTLSFHGKDIDDLKKEDADQWTAINQLRKVVWGWAPFLSFLGSMIGAIIVALIMHHFKK